MVSKANGHSMEAKPQSMMTNQNTASQDYTESHLHTKLDLRAEEFHQLLYLISEIDHFKGKWSALPANESRYLVSLRKNAAIASVASSTRIEGNTMSAAEVSTFLQQTEPITSETRHEQEVLGYYEALQWIHRNYAHTELSQDNMLSLHAQMLKYSKKDISHRGDFKQKQNHITIKEKDDHEKIIFTPTPPDDVSKEMSVLINWIIKEQKFTSKHPLLVIALFIYEFLSIHPFYDGNGRMSRLLTSWLLLHAGYSFVKYDSLEKKIEKRKDLYYEALIISQRTRQQDNRKENIFPWVIFFILTLKELCHEMDEKYQTMRKDNAYLNKRQLKILAFIKEHNPVKLGDVANYFADISINTIKKDLQYLQSENVIHRIGERRGAVYYPKSD